MKKRMILLSVFVLFSCLFLNSEAQVVTKKAQNYSQSVVIRLKEILKYVVLPESKQLQVLQYLSKEPEDSKSLADLKDRKFKITPEFRNILGELYFADFITNYQPTQASPSEWVLCYRKQLKLPDELISKFRRKIEEISNVEKLSSKERTLKQNAIISETLTNEQIKIYCENKSSSLSKWNVKTMIEKLRKENNLVLFDTISISRTLFSFQKRRNYNREFLALTGQQGEIKKEDAKILQEKPFVLYQIDAYSSSLANSYLKSIFNLRLELNLSKKSIDFLLHSIADMDKRSSNETLGNIKFNSVAFQDSVIIKLLDDNQIRKLVISDKGEKRTIQIKNEWNELLKYGLVKESEQDKVVEELKNYHINLDVAGELFRLKRDRRNSYLRIELLENPPEHLLKLAEARKDKN